MRTLPKYKLILDTPEDGDYIFLGAFTKIPEEVIQPDMDWTPYLPKKEFQDIGRIETFACATFTILNCVEILIKKKYGLDRNYSDRFLSVVSGTDRDGNVPKVVAEFLRKIGVVTEDVYPFNSTGFDDFYKPLSPKLHELAREFNAEWDFMHEFVEGKDIDKALTMSPLLISVSAWFKDSNGLFYCPKGMRNNHATTYVKKATDHRLVFDSYDSYFGTHLKKVHLDAIPMTARRFWIEKKKTTSRLSLMKKLCNWLHR